MILALLLHLFAAQQYVATTGCFEKGNPRDFCNTVKIPPPGTNGAGEKDFIVISGDALPVESFSFSNTTQSPSFTFTIPIPAGCTASVQASNVVISCPIVSPPPPPPPPPALKITTPITLPSGKVGTAYSVDISKLTSPTGGVAPYSFSTGQNFPAWLQLSSAGILSGTPTTAGTFSIQFDVTDSSVDVINNWPPSPAATIVIAK